MKDTGNNPLDLNVLCDRWDLLDVNTAVLEIQMVIILLVAFLTKSSFVALSSIWLEMRETSDLRK